MKVVIQYISRTYHLLLTAILLIFVQSGLSLAGTTGIRELTRGGSVLRTKRFECRSDIHTQEGALPERLLLNEHSSFSPPGLHNCTAHGASGCSFVGGRHIRCAQSLHDQSSTKLRHWRWVYSCIHCAQLDAHYPAHGFW